MKPMLLLVGNLWVRRVWRMYEDYSGGPSTDLYPHCLTPVVYMLGVGMPSKVVAVGGKYRYPEREIPDTYNTLIEYSNQLVIAVLGSQGNNYPGAQGRGAGRRCCGAGKVR